VRTRIAQVQHSPAEEKRGACQLSVCIAKAGWQGGEVHLHDERVSIH